MQNVAGFSIKKNYLHLIVETREISQIQVLLANFCVTIIEKENKIQIK